MKPTATVLVILLAFAVTGCASMFNDRSGPVAVTSQRPAQLIQNGEVIGSAPGEISADGMIEARQEGCEPHFQPVRKSLSGWFFANLLTGYLFPVGMLIDAATGNMWKYSPRQFHVPCQPVEGS